jgi:hypothetical protein
MPRPYQVLILGVETKVGQAVLESLRAKVPALKVAVLAKSYPPSIKIPPYLVPRKSAFHQVETVVCCSTQALRLEQEATQAACPVINALRTETDVIGKLCATKFGFVPNDRYHSYRSASGIRFWAFLWIAQRWLRFPSFGANKKWQIEVKSDGPFVQAIEFDSIFYAFLFWILGSLAHLLPVPPESFASSSSAWRFVGTTRPGESEYDFEVEADQIDTEKYLPDFVLSEVFDKLKAKPEEIDTRLLFDGIRLRVVRFEKRDSPS